MIGITDLKRIYTAQEVKPYKIGQIVDGAEGIDGEFQFVKYHHGENSIRGIRGLPSFWRMDATATDDVTTDADTTLYDVSANFNGNTTSRKPAGILVGDSSPGLVGGGGVYQNLQFGWIQRKGPSIVDLWTDGNVVQGDQLYANRNPLVVSGAAANVGGLVSAPALGTIVSAALTIGSPMGVITDDGTDINADATRTLTITCGHVSGTSSQVLANCISTPDTNAALVVHATPTAGQFVLTIRNPGTGNYTSVPVFGYSVMNALRNSFGLARQTDETVQILVLFPAGRTPDGTAALASYRIDETVTWTGAGTGVVRETFDSYSGTTRTQWGMRLDTVTGTLTGTATGGTSLATCANTLHEILYQLKGKNVILDIAA